MTKSRAAKAYQGLEAGVVNSYKAMELGIVTNFTKLCDRCVKGFLTREGETVEQAKTRMEQETQRRKGGVKNEEK